jgi:hypothetical protein
MARIFYLGAPPTIRPPSGASVTSYLQATGNNSGNLLIGHAIHRHLKIDTLSTDLSMDPARINAEFDRVVIGAANFIYPKFDFAEYARFLERIHLPCVIIGLGAQAPRYGTKIEVPEGTRRMLQIVSERSKSLGVRGIFTAATLVDMGITNVRLIGCPSMYWTCRPALEFRPRVEGGPLRIAVNGSANVVLHSANPEAARRLEAALFRLSFRDGHPYILQNEAAMMRIAAGEDATPDPALVRSLIASSGLEGVDQAAFVHFLRERTRSYFDIDRWHAAMGEFDFVVGSRFHGCLIALQAGVPACVFVHDARTREMCELLHLPHRSIAQAALLDDVPALYRSLDLAATATAYRHLYQNYITFLDENGLEHRLAR